MGVASVLSYADSRPTLVFERLPCSLGTLSRGPMKTHEPAPCKLRAVVCGTSCQRGGECGMRLRRSEVRFSSEVVHRTSWLKYS